MKPTFKCNDCKKVKPTHTNGGTGYARIGKASRKVCYDCCAIRDRKSMEKTGKIALYLTTTDKGLNEQGIRRIERKVTNWPGTLSFPIVHLTTGSHNIAGSRTDIWFVINRQYWHGIRYGKYTDLVHCKRTKQFLPPY